MSERFARERAVAVEAVQRACRVCRSVQASLAPALEKMDRSPATVADYAAQAVVSATLAAAFPEDPLLAEESVDDLRSPEREAFRSRVISEVRALLPEQSGEAVLEAIARGGGRVPGSAGRCWVLDPLDGTKGFLRREQYAVALALLVDGRVVVGVLGCPELPQQAAALEGPRGSIFVAVAGQGARSRPLEGGADEERVTVDAVDQPAAARFCESVESGHSSHETSSRVLAALGVRAAPLRIDSQCKYAAVARGEASVYLRLPTRADYEEKIWDHAAGLLIVEEAGGRATDLDGAPIDLSQGRTLRRNRGVVVTNGTLHEQVLAAAQAATAQAEVSR